MSLSDIFSDIKVAASVATITWSSGLATFLEWIPMDIGKLATLIGIVLSLVLIRSHLKRAKREEEEHRVKMELLIRELAQKKE